MQELWLRKGDWDAPIPDDLKERWIRYYEDLPKLSRKRISRWTGRHRDNLRFELHGFADASNRAYAAVIYLRILHSLIDIQISLVAAKTKVAPLKTVSIPRLELNAVVLLSRLFDWVLSSLNLKRPSLYGWTDSKVTLAWLRQHPSRWNSYVANRVAEVQTRLPSIRWYHVPSRDNPADCASRGLFATELDQHKLWWLGPPWLQRPSIFWPINGESHSDVEDATETALTEARRAEVHHVEEAHE